ncbi:hypothetical protein [Vibrio barjaei]|uniref:hypothetical protein n=1 Tax=Vibrio barjaei TaxID=1676683 RepID=UPI0022840D4C|nr:hypothetical protein [Vibrio barjaei]MCY9874030.1 hypothetical protein [Vibrio barjaei]
MKVKIGVIVCSVFISGMTFATCPDGGESCVESVYEREKGERTNRTESGPILDSELPSSGSIEKNVDLSDYATKSALSSVENNAYGNDWAVENRLNAKIAHLEHLIDNLQVKLVNSPGGIKITTQMNNVPYGTNCAMFHVPAGTSVDTHNVYYFHHGYGASNAEKAWAGTTTGQFWANSVQLCAGYAYAGYGRQQNAIVIAVPK